MVVVVIKVEIVVDEEVAVAAAEAAVEMEIGVALIQGLSFFLCRMFLFFCNSSYEYYFPLILTFL